MTKVASVQMLRGMAALMVVAFHALSIQGKYLSGVSLLPSIFELGQTGVDLFFVISGFVMVLSSHDKRGLEAAGVFLRDRFFRIYPVYWFYFFALLVVFLLLPSIINNSQGGRVDLFRSFFLLPSDTLPILMVAWTLTHEVWFYMVFALILLLPGSVRVPALIAWCALIVGCALWGAGDVGSPAIKVAVHVFTIEFIAGCLVGYLYVGVKFISRSALLVVALLSVSCFCVAIWGEVIVESSLARAALYGGGYATLLAFLVFCERQRLFHGVGFLKKMGDISYSLYLSHVLVLSLCGRIWLYLNPLEGVVGGVVFWLFTFTATIVAAHFAYVLIERPILRSTLYRFRSGPVRGLDLPTTRV